MVGRTSWELFVWRRAGFNDYCLQLCVWCVVLWCASKPSLRHLLPQYSLWTRKDVGCRFLLNVGTCLLDCKMSCENLKLSRVSVWKLLSPRVWWSVMWLKFMNVSEKKIRHQSLLSWLCRWHVMSKRGYNVTKMHYFTCQKALCFIVNCTRI